MKALFTFLFFLYSLHTFASSDTLKINSTWQGTITVNKTTVVQRGVTLTILPGTKVFFGEGVALKISGDLKIMGRENQQVILTTQTGGWGGIEFMGSTGELHNSLIDFTIIEKVKNVGTKLTTHNTISVVNYDKLNISNSIIRYNNVTSTGGINIRNASTSIYRTLIYRNSGEIGAINIFIDSGQKPVIENCTIVYNSGSSADATFLRYEKPSRNATTSYPTTPKFKNCIIGRRSGRP